MDQHWYVFVDLMGTFAFGISGALAGREKRLDPFGVFVATYATACGGGIIRDLCLGSLPPVGMSDWRYLACVVLASAVTMWMHPLLALLRHPIVWFDSLGLGLFAVVGAQKSMQLANNVEVALVLGVIGAVGGGVLRDVLLNRVPIILQKEIYALAALAGAVVQVSGHWMGWSPALTPWAAVSTCFVIRSLALRYSWSLPRKW
ncbi:MAG: hypothetical protein JWP22_4245 [Ramlibacter sp.]|jgi:uncharacterized membrane protein YeiH|nr:hypothetical protein [Ramlibacter sp.]